MKVLLLLSILMGTLTGACSSSAAAPIELNQQVPSLNVTVTRVSEIHPGVLDTPVPAGGEQTSPKVKSSFLPAPKTPTLPLPTSTPQPVFGICSPLTPYRLNELREIVSDPYRPPPAGKEERHHGIDLSHYRRGDLLSIEGVPVQAVMAGRVAAALADSYPYGNVIIIETRGDFIPAEWRERLLLEVEDSVYILYAHMMDAPRVQLDEYVDSCQELGKVGKTGNTVEPHLHLETRKGPPGVSFPQMRYYKPDATEVEKESYLRWRIGGESQHFDPMVFFSP